MAADKTTAKAKPFKQPKPDWSDRLLLRLQLHFVRHPDVRRYYETYSQWSLYWQAHSNSMEDAEGAHRDYRRSKLRVAVVWTSLAMIPGALIVVIGTSMLLLA